MSDKYSFIDEELKALKKKGLYKEIPVLEGPQGARVKIMGRKVLNFCSNNYLGLAADSRLKEAAREAIENYGVGPGAVRTIAGTMELHQRLERELAAFKGVEATLVLQSGFNANLAAIPALVGKGDTIISDQLNHASIIDGARLSRARIEVYPHNEMQGLEKVLKKDLPGRRLIVTDGVFSMDGDLAPLPEIVELAEKYGALTLVDDAHGEGVLGDQGQGIVDHFNLHGRVDLEIGTFSKALGVMGGSIAGSNKMIEYLKQVARPFTFSSALTVADTAATLAAVHLLQQDDTPVKKLWNNTRYFKEGIEALGFDTGISETPITPVMMGEARLASEFSQRLMAEGVFAGAIGFPLVPRNKARIRVMISAIHQQEDLDQTLSAFARVGKKLQLID